ncbi:MAG: antibiotic biosynthesis monooxygenase [Planctomycetes bacterium]|nr:antibiotic biosynthesis monooxygenase [Planctomycetota bacterium]
MYIIAARLRIRPEHREDFLRASRAIIAGTRDEGGCIFYALHEDVHDPCNFLFYEEWQDRAAIDAHFAEDHFADFSAVIEPWVVDRQLTVHKVAASEQS